MKTVKDFVRWFSFKDSEENFKRIALVYRFVSFLDIEEHVKRKGFSKE